MASSFNLQVKGLDKLIKDFEKLPNEIQDGLDRSLNAGANNWANGAVRDAPVYDGKLRGSIRSERKGYLWYAVSANVFYAAYVEFGTKKKVQVPSDLQAIAAEFKGGRGGGSFQDLLKNIERWVKKQGIAGIYNVKSRKLSQSKASKAAIKSAAFLIARSIAKNGISPHPYFFKQKVPTETFIENEIRELEKQIQL